MSVVDKTMASDGIDMVSKTQALLQRCIAARQWQHVGQIEGLSQHDARVKHDRQYAMAFAVPKDAPTDEVVKDTLGAARVLRPRVKPTRLEDDAQWMRTTKERIAALGMTAQEVSRYLGFDKTHITTMMSVVGSRGPISTGRVDRALTALERQRAAA